MAEFTEGGLPLAILKTCAVSATLSAVKYIPLQKLSIPALEYCYSVEAPSLMPQGKETTVQASPSVAGRNQRQMVNLANIQYFIFSEGQKK